MADIPEESNVDTESDGIGLGEQENCSDGGLDKEDYSDGDHENDGDYIDTHASNLPESDEDQLEDEPEEQVEEVLTMARKRKKKASSSLKSSAIK